MFSDFKFVLRQLTKTPGFTALVVLTFALGIGACTAMFSVLNAVLFRPLNLPAADRLVFLRELTPTLGSQLLPVNASHYVTWRERARNFSDLGVASPAVAALNAAGDAMPVALSLTTASFLPTLGISPLHGRLFVAEDERPEHNTVVVISERLWRGRFNADPDILGRTVLLDRRAHTIVGVLPDTPVLQSLRLAPAGFAAPDLFKPLVFSAEELAQKLGRHNYAVFARLRDGVAPADAQRELDHLGATIVREAGGTDELRGVVTPLHELLTGASRRSFWLLSGAIGAVLLIGAVNLSGLLLARAERRRGEIALRVALGATMGRILRLTLLEPLLIAALGAVAGFLLADMIVQLLPRFVPGDLPRLHEISLDPAVVLFCAGTAALCGLGAGLVPAWHLMRHTPGAEVSRGGRSVAGSRGSAGSHRMFVLVQVALSVVLLAGAGLLAHSFQRLIGAERGHDSHGVLTARVLLPGSKYRTSEQRLQFLDRLTERAGAAPEITGAAVASHLPLQGETWIDKVWVIGDGRSLLERPNVNVRFISPDYFATLGQAVLAGRSFTAADRPNESVIISAQLAQILWPGLDSLGRRLTRDGEREAVVVGVVADVRADADRAPVPTLYRPIADWPPLRTNILVRTPGPAAAALPALRSAVRAIDPDVALASVQSLDELAHGAVAGHRFRTGIIMAFALAATLLTALGLYSLVAYAVASRGRELGVRLALGAAPGALPWEIVRQFAPSIAIGLGVGIAGYLAAAPLAESLLFESQARDPRLLAIVAALIALITLLAAWLPARRAAKIDPLVALRAE